MLSWINIQFYGETKKNHAHHKKNLECYHVSRKKPIRHKKTKPLAATEISLLCCDLLVCHDFPCDWSTQNQNSCNFRCSLWCWRVEQMAIRLKQHHFQLPIRNSSAKDQSQTTLHCHPFIKNYAHFVIFSCSIIITWKIQHPLQPSLFSVSFPDKNDTMQASRQSVQQ